MSSSVTHLPQQPLWPVQFQLVSPWAIYKVVLKLRQVICLPFCTRVLCEQNLVPIFSFSKARGAQVRYGKGPVMKIEQNL